MAGFDDIKNKDLLSGKGRELIEQRKQRMNTMSVQEIRELEQLAQNQAAMDKLTAGLEQNLKANLEALADYGNRNKEVLNRMEILEKGRHYSANKMFKQSVTTMTGSSATASDIAAASRSTMAFGPAITMAQNQSTLDIQDSVTRNKVLLGQRHDLIRETTRSGDDAQLASHLSARDKLVSNIGLGQAALSAQKRLGIDTQSAYYNAVEITQRVRADQEKGAIQTGVAQGQFGSRKAIEEQLDAATKKLIATFEQFDASVKSADKAEQEKAGALTKQFQEAHKDLERNKSILGEMNRQGGGSGQSSWQTGSNILTNLGTIGMAISQGVRYAGVTSEMTQGQNRIGMANMANQRFTDAYSATQGDMKALRRVLSDAHGDEVKRGLLMHGREDAAKLGETVSSGAKALGSTIDAAAGPGGIMAGIKGLASGGPAGAGANVVLEGIAKASPDIQNFAFNAIDYGKQNTQIQAMLQAQQQQKDLSNAINQIDDFSSQSAADQQRALTLSTRGLGVGSLPADFNKSITYQGSGRLGASTELPGTSAYSTTTGDLGMPMAGKHSISSEYALRKDPFGNTIKMHSGTDFRARVGTPLLSVGSGKVVESGYNEESGNYVRVQVGDNVFGYAHMKAKSQFNAGDRVSKGEQVGEVGMTGKTKGPHLHLSATDKYGNRFDPMSVLPGGSAAAVGTSIAQRGVTSTGIKGGGDRQSVQQLLSDPGVISLLAEATGLGTKDISKLAGMGTVGLGKEFTRDQGQGAIRDISRAGALARSGYMQSPEQYMQARSQMTGVGGGEADLEEILKNAVANGMDSSKNIMEMVNATTSLASRSAAQGINSFAGAAQGLGMGIDVLRKSGVSENMATAAAANAANAAEDLAGDRGATLANVIETARLRKSFGGASRWQMEAMQTAGIAQARELRDLYKSGKTDAARKLGIKMGVGTKGGVVDLAGAEALLESTTEQATRAATGFGVDRRLEESVQEARRTGRTFTDEEDAYVNATSKGTTGTSGVALHASASPLNKAGKKNAEIALGKGVASGEDQIRASAMGDAKVFEAGVKNITEALGGMEALGQTMVKVSEALDPEAFAESTRQAALDFAAPATALGTEISLLKTSVENLTDAIKKEIGHRKDQIVNGPKHKQDSEFTPQEKRQIKELDRNVNRNQGGRN